MEESRERIHIPKLRCPYCHDEIPKGVEPIVCPECHAGHHSECLAEHGRCATCETEHPRFAGGASHAPELALRVRAARAQGLLSRLGISAVNILVLVIGLIAFLANPDAIDAIVGPVVAIAAVLALMGVELLPPHLRTRRRSLGLLCLVIAAGVLLLPALSDHIFRRHLGAVWVWLLWLSGLGALAMTFGGRVAEPPVPKKDADKANKDLK